MHKSKNADIYKYVEMGGKDAVILSLSVRAALNALLAYVYEKRAVSPFLSLWLP